MGPQTTILYCLCCNICVNMLTSFLLWAVSSLLMSLIAAYWTPLLERIYQQSFRPQTSSLINQGSSDVILPRAPKLLNQALAPFQLFLVDSQGTVLKDEFVWENPFLCFGKTLVHTRFSYFVF